MMAAKQRQTCPAPGCCRSLAVPSSTRLPAGTPVLCPCPDQHAIKAIDDTVAFGGTQRRLIAGTETERTALLEAHS